jgi:hypothetical protein
MYIFILYSVYCRLRITLAENNTCIHDVHNLLFPSALFLILTLNSVHIIG